jgi:hypothetical protein
MGKRNGDLFVAGEHPAGRIGVLKVFQTESFTGSTWVTELELSIKILNALLKKHGIRLKFETTATKADAQVLLSTKAGNGLHAENELGLKGTSMMDSAHISSADEPHHQCHKGRHLHWRSRKTPHPRPRADPCRVPFPSTPTTAGYSSRT